MADSNNTTGTIYSDLILGTDENETIDGAGGFDIIDGSGGNDYIRGGDPSVWDEFFGEANLLMGGSGNDTVEGGDGFDLVHGGSGDDSIDGGGGSDLLRGGSGNDTIEGGEGNDLLLGGTGDDSLGGGAGDDWMWGGEGNDVLVGGEGNDTLVGGEGNDTLTGGAGEDVFVITADTGTTTITDFNVANDTIFLGHLTNPPTLAQLLAAMTDLPDSNNDGTADGVTIDLSAYGGGTVILQGVTRSDLMDGSNLDAGLFDFGHDTIEGTTDDEFFYGGVGDDTLTGGGGNDAFRFADNHGDDTITDFDVANDRLDLSGLTTAITAEQLLAVMTDLPDSDNDGTADGVTIDLSAYGGGTITLQGVTRADLMDGANLNTALFDLPDGTADTTWTGTDHADVVSSGEAGLTFTAKAGGDWVFAGEGNDTIEGAGGNDWLQGEEGEDSIEGGEGNDTILGGEGNDYIDGGTGNDRIYGGEGNDTILGGEGNDWIRGDAGDDSITGGIGNDAIGGNEGNDTIDGGAGDDFLYGGEGDDSLTGGAGTDTFVFGTSHGNDTITDFADGTDIIDLSALDGVTSFDDLTITADGNDVVIDTGQGTIRLEGVSTTDLDASDFELSTTGDDTDNTIEGGAGWDDLEGLGGNDSLSGGAGVDVLDGGAGNDVMTGGADVDIFVFEEGHGNDTITDFEDGTDIIDLRALDGVTQLDDLSIADDGNGNAVITTSPGNTITLTGISAEDLDADDFVFSTTGDDTDNTIEGGWWSDTIEGLGGDDSLTGSAGADTFVFGAGHGNDTITDFTDDWDSIDLSGITSVTQLSDLTFTSNDDGVVIDTGEGTILLQGVDLGDIDEDDFVFYEPPMDDGV